MVDSEPLGALFGLGAPEPVLIEFVAGRSLKYSLTGSLTKNVMSACSKGTKGHVELGATFREYGGEEP